jgi:hypothetical protein
LIVSLSAVAPTNICSADCWPLLDEAVPPVVRAAGPFAFELSGDWRAAALAWEELGCPYDAGLARLGGDVPAVGKAGAQIAARMCISPKTADHHVTAILAKLGVHSRAEAARKLAE